MPNGRPFRVLCVLTALGRSYHVPQLLADRAHPRPARRVVLAVALERVDYVTAGELPAHLLILRALR
jgi:hypothetical protein